MILKNDQKKEFVDKIIVNSRKCRVLKMIFESLNIDFNVSNF